MASRPVYVPRKSRRGKQRLHGAFTGGFSAGYFNTVGSAEGWQPSQATTTETAEPPQRPDEFMDEQDHNEWGGPMQVRKEYQATSRQRQQPASADVLWTVDEPPESVGRRLLGVLGWRAGGDTAYVPDHNVSSRQDGIMDDQEHKVLSRKRLRKIQLQQQATNIPPPKLDTCGLGYEPFANAPEFQRHKERRKQLAKERAQRPTSSVYRVSNVLGEDHDRAGLPTQHDIEEDAHVSYETVQDFVGTKSVGGFALREDEDDVYDDQPLAKVSNKVRLDSEAFDTVAYEHESDEDQEDLQRASQEPKADFGGVLSSWATASSRPAGTTTKSSDAPVGGGVTADGRPPLPGFVLGGSGVISKQFKGPDLPEDYQVQRHVFGPDDHPLVYKALSRAVQLEVADERRKAAMEEALKANARSHAPTLRVPDVVSKRDEPMAGTAFVGLASAMKSRFTTSVASTEPSTESTRTAGLSRPTVDGTAGSTTAADTVAGQTTDTSQEEIRITRTLVSFAPESLLCKRFHVPMPKNLVATDSSPDRTREQAYFHDEILAKVAASERKTDKVKGSALLLEETEDVVEDAHAQRPSMAIYKSIYEPDSESSDSEKEKESKTDPKTTEAAEVRETKEAEAVDTKRIASPEHATVKEAGRMIPYDETEQSKSQQEDVSSRDRHRRRQSRSSESSDLSSDRRDRRKRRKKEERKERRRRDEKKKKSKKKKKKSSSR